MINDIVLHFDDKINEHPGNMSGFIMMIFSLFFYAISGVFIIVIGIEKSVCIIFLSIAVSLQMFIPLGGMLEVCISGKGTCNEGIKNALLGAGSVFWCCCYS